MILYENRKEAGESLGKEIKSLELPLVNPIVFGIPRGGIPIGHGVAKHLECPLDTIVLRKLPIPRNPEAGFGAVTLDKTAVLNEMLLSRLHLSDEAIDHIIDDVYAEVLRRNEMYRRGRPFPNLEKRSVILTDDGLASGYTMLAALKYSRKHDAGEVIVASPVAHRTSYEMLAKKSDRILVSHVSDLPYFAVASFYESFPDLKDEVVMHYLEQR